MVSGIQLSETANLGPISSPILNQNIISPPLVNAPTVDFFCETDPPRSKGGSGLPSLQISNDKCSGQTLARFGQQGSSCSLQVTFVPQPATWAAALNAGQGLDDFLQLNSMWCGDPNNPAELSCEIDSGRFPVEIKTNPPSPLRMFPSAGMDFASVVKGTGSSPLASRSLMTQQTPVLALSISQLSWSRVPTISRLTTALPHWLQTKVAR